MPVESILIVLFYSVKPYLWVLALFLMLPVCEFLFIPPDYRLMGNGMHLLVSLAVGILTGLAVPSLMMSQLSYVVTIADWAALVLIMLGISVYVWLILRPLNRGIG
ncbi:hypothetical protein [Vibrio quintilis]|uniref:Uncharacterized protein n=1 Tax=Vibrio quintilis TaxID=1117707 RepID=A0A1M7YR66_9VIBR|nr:hypothetical protein [Vibrio quintilis]SHO55080.1 hypothetical protein VQ7734_00799 [Vibrio quintilis]